MYKEKRNIDPILKKGMDITISILKQEYPFIIDWDYNEDTDKYHTALYINLICDLKKVSEFYDSEVHFHYKDNPISKHVYPLGPLNKNREIGSDEKYEFYKEILNELNEIYGNLPEDYTEKTEWDETKPIRVDHFIFYNKQETINESNKKTIYLELINNVVEDYINNDVICDIEVSYDKEDDMYTIMILFDTEEMLKIRDRGRYARQIRNKIGEEIVKYVPDFMNFYVGSYVRYCK